VTAKRSHLVAVGAAVVAELVLGAFLVARGGGNSSSAANPNPYRVGEGFPVPPPCSMIDRALVNLILGTEDNQLTESYRLEDDDPVRTCTFKAAKPELGEVAVSMISHLVGPNGALEVNAIGISDLTPFDNFATEEFKRYYNYASVNFELDNLDVGVRFQFPATSQRFIPSPSEAQRMRADVRSLTNKIADTLTPRNKTGPTLPSIVPSTRPTRR
jgi:hypothetical protein